MSQLRIRFAQLQAPERCEWALSAEGRGTIVGEGPLSSVPRHAERIQVVLPANEVLLIRARLPQSVSRRRGDSVLAYAVEERIVGDPEASRAILLGSAGEEHVLAVLDRRRLERLCDALHEHGIRRYEVVSEILLLPWQNDGWCLAWDGQEGFVRTGQLEGATTDCGDRGLPPLSLRLMLEDAAAHAASPAQLTVCARTQDALPDLSAWQTALGLPVRSGGTWDWRANSAVPVVALFRERRHWGDVSEILKRLRPAGWLVAAALAVQAIAMVADWAVLAHEARQLRSEMVARFRAAVPDAVAVVDPTLQMRRKLAEARHAAGKPDESDFLPMVVRVAAVLRTLPPGALRVLSYESGRMTLELDASRSAVATRALEGLRRAGFGVTTQAPSSRGGRASMVIVLRVL